MCASKPIHTMKLDAGILICGACVRVSFDVSAGGFKPAAVRRACYSRR